MLKNYLANKKIKKFILEMTIELSRRYRCKEPYTEGQVKATLKELGHGKEFEELALFIYCDEEAYKHLGLDEALKKKYRGYQKSYYVSDVTESYSGADGGGDGD